MLTKISIALAVFLAISASAADARTWEPGARNDSGPGPVLINRCAHGNWDFYGVRCDSGE